MVLILLVLMAMVMVLIMLMVLTMPNTLPNPPHRRRRARPGDANAHSGCTNTQREQKHFKTNHSLNRSIIKATSPSLRKQSTWVNARWTISPVTYFKLLKLMKTLRSTWPTIRLTHKCVSSSSHRGQRRWPGWAAYILKDLLQHWLMALRSIWRLETSAKRRFSASTPRLVDLSTEMF